MLQLGQLLVCVAQTISLTLWLVFTGYERLSELHSSLLWLFTVCSMALLRATCLNNFVTLLTCQIEPIFGYRLPVFLMFAHLSALLLVTSHLLSWSQDQEHSPSWCYYCNIAVVISSNTEDTLILAVISWHCCVTCTIVDLALFTQATINSFIM